MFHSTKFIAVLGVWAMSFKWILYGPSIATTIVVCLTPTENRGEFLEPAVIIYITNWLAFCIYEEVERNGMKLDEIHKTLKDNKSSETPPE